MISYLTTERVSSGEVIILSKDTKNELKLYETNKKRFIDRFLRVSVENHSAQVPAGFDIETSSFLHPEKLEKCATMYIWQMCFKFNQELIFIYGRTWEEWSQFIYLLRKISRTIKGKIIIYVHNLAYEFHWFYTHIYLTKVFSRKKRHPMYAQSNEIMFKCSYFLSNYSLRNLAKERGYTEKENMDYKLIRHSNTPLTTEEISYALTDVRIICEYISDEILKNKKIQSIPMTSTGYARRYCIEYITEHTNFLSYRNFIKSILPIEPNIFKRLYEAYTGAFTHANFYHANDLLEDVHCVDYTSHYPSMMSRKRFPMKFREASPDHFKLLKGMAMVLIIKFYCLSAKTHHSILSFNKCVTTGEYELDNGRLRYADELKTCITDLDFENIELFYTYDHYVIEELYVAKYEYLPKELIMSILELYKNKTELKGVVGKEEPYLRSKELINAVYGMAVTNPLNDEITFEDGEWRKEVVNVENGLNKYASGQKLFLAYQWGVWVTAWARWELLHTVYKIGDDVVYCDTDSIKYLNNHDDIIEEDNKRILEENYTIQKLYNIPESYFSPKTIKGKTKPLGLWDKEDDYAYFKTLGAKRYCFSYYEDHYNEMIDDYFNSLKPTVDEKDYKYLKENFFITVAGLSKVNGKISILRQAEAQNLSPYDIFTYDKELIIPEDESGKMCFLYSKPNEHFKCMLTDYLGNIAEVEEDSYIYGESIEFNFNVTEDYATLLGIISISENVGGEFDSFRLDLRTE